MMDFLNDIPIWAYGVAAGVGAVLAGILIYLHARAPVPPGAQSKGATPQLIFGILSLLLLTVVPLVLMTIVLTQEDDGDRRRDRNRDRDRDRVEEDRSDRREGPGDTTWLVEFTVDGVTYRGQYEPRDGSGPMKVAYTHEGQEKRIRQDCTLTGERDIRVTCRNPRILAGNSGYSADNFELTLDGEDEMTGRIASIGSGTATFRRGTDPKYEDASWDAPGTDPQAMSNTPAPAPSAGGDLAARLSAAAAQQRSRLPIRSGITTITAIDTSGTTLSMWAQIAGDMSATQWAQIEQGMRAQTCAGSFRALTAAGASVTYHLIDSGQEQRSVTVSSC